MNQKVDTALHYASQGLKVLPLHYVNEHQICSCGGVERNPSCKPGKHPYGKLAPKGLKNATDDPLKIRDWWSNDKLNIGIVTGKDSGFFVVDQDDRDGGAETIISLENEYGSLPKTLIQRTGNGRHILFKMPEAIEIPNSQKLLGAGIDIRGTGGYICAAPSKHVSGKIYEWSETEGFDRGLIADAPTWLVKKLERKTDKQLYSNADNDDLIHIKLFNIPESIRDGEGREDFILKYAGHLRGSGVDQPEIEKTLLEYNKQKIHPPLSDEQVLDRARRYAKKQLPTTNLAAESQVVELIPGDIENGRLFAKTFRGELLYVYSAKKWLHWDGKRWAWCDSGQEQAAAKQAANILLDHATALLKANPNDPNSKKLMQHAIKTRDERHLCSMEHLARSEHGMSIASVSELDSDPWHLNTQNGVVVLRTGEVLLHDPKLLLAKICNASYIPTAQCPQWKQFLNDIFCGDQELIEFIQRALGYSLTGHVTEESMFFMFGYGANGKSVFINTIINVLADYAMTAPASMLALRRNEDKGRPSPEVARMVGARFAVANETQSTDRLDEQMVKILVSRERIAARPLYGGYFEFMPTHTLWVRGNHKPIITGDDHGIWRRIQLIPFTRTFSQEEIDPHLEEKLQLEADGILAWMVEGCLEWQKHGLKPPPAVLNASKQYRKESDLLGQWIDEDCDTGLSFRSLQKSIYGAYALWCSTNGIRAMSKTMFSRKLYERGCVEGWINRERAYVGIQLKATSAMSNAA